jgi:alpha/beta superfamily hydrolase
MNDSQEIPTPKATSRIILKASKANTNLVMSQPPLKKQRGSQDSSTIQSLAKELRKKGL